VFYLEKTASRNLPSQIGIPVFSAKEPCRFRMLNILRPTYDGDNFPQSTDLEEHDQRLDFLRGGCMKMGRH
jgi:hypothetical protein